MGKEAAFVAGSGADRDWRTAVSSCLDDLAALPDGADMGFVYVSDYFAAEAGEILTVLRGRTGIDLWVGTTGIGVLAGRQQFFDEPAVVAMVASVGRENRELVSGERAAAPGFPPWFGVMHADPRTPDLPDAVAELGGRLGGYWVGGLTASRGAHPIVARRVVHEGMSGVVFSDAVQVRTGLSQGCAPIGPVHEITRAERNIVVELDGRPAFEVFREEIGEVLVRNLNRVPGFIFAGLPVSGADRPDYLVRDILAFDPQYGLIAVGAEISAGERLMFCRRDAASAAADMERMLDELAGHMAGAAPKGGLYYSCLGRGPNMFDAERTELDMIAERFGDVPLVGFFCNGEISNARLYTYTGVLSLFF